MFPSLYETGEQRTAFPKKGPMFPDMLVFLPLLPNTGRENYHCMRLPLWKRETSENLTQSFHTPVNKPRAAQSLRELPALRPTGCAEPLAVILLYKLYYILRAPGVANGTGNIGPFSLLVSSSSKLKCSLVAAQKYSRILRQSYL